MKVRVVNQPTGLLNGYPWPEAGEFVDLPDAVAEGMIEAGTVEKVRAASTPDKSEKRPAASKNVETRKA